MRKGDGHEARKQDPGGCVRDCLGVRSAGLGGGIKNRRDRTAKSAGSNQVRKEDQGLAAGIRQDAPKAHRYGRRRTQEDGGGLGQARRGLERRGQEGKRREVSPADGRVSAESPAAEPGSPSQEKGDSG